MLIINLNINYMADVHLIPITASVVQSSSMRGLGWAILLLLLPKQLIIVGITTSKHTG